MSDTANLKPYFTEDSRYVVVGGETCDDIYSPQNDCFGTHPDARADSELERLHYSYLNAQYNNDVNNDWQSGGCMDQIKRRLGYRFELLDGTYSDAAQTGQSISVNINLRNVGYASPFNQRDLILILRDTSNNQFWFAELPDDPRFWFAEDASLTISHTICIPDFMPVGSYELLLHLPDPEEDLYDRPEYAIRLANKLADNSDVWEATTGYNRLGHYVDINSTANAEVCNGGIPLSSTDSTASIPQNSLNSIKVFPNPATETLHIAGLESHDLVGLKIISTLGKIEIDGQISENGVDISALSSGLYLVKIELSNGSTRTFKVYKK